MPWQTTTKISTKIRFIFIVWRFVTFWRFLILLRGRPPFCRTSWDRTFWLENLLYSSCDHCHGIFIFFTGFIFWRVVFFTSSFTSYSLFCLGFFFIFSKMNFMRQKFPSRSSKASVLRFWASLIAVTLGPHLFLGRHQKIFLTIFSMV